MAKLGTVKKGWRLLYVATGRLAPAATPTKSRPTPKYDQKEKRFVKVHKPGDGSKRPGLYVTPAGVGFQGTGVLIAEAK